MSASVLSDEAIEVAHPPTRVKLEDVRIDPVWAWKIPGSLAMRRRVLPLCRLGEEVAVACTGEVDPTTRQTLQRTFGLAVRWVEVEADALRSALQRIYGSASRPSPAVRSRTAAGREPDGEQAAAICDEIFQAAMLREASDIHLVPTENHLLVQLRVDGELEVFRQLGNEIKGSVISRIKVLSGLDIAEKRAPQDGRFSTRVGPAATKLDMRVATLPTRFGERVTMRLLGSQAQNISLESLGMNQQGLQTFTKTIRRPHGMILLTGPTGSGKSTTLYAAITALKKTLGGNVITVEDPIEYDMQGVSQVEVDATDNVNFSKALRSILRHDPDIVMIGEIRDAETANIAVKASLTGHLVLSTLHTNTAAGVVTRLVDMGVERFLVGATLRLAVAQRLVRRLCPHCRRRRPMRAAEALALGREELVGMTIYQAGGCVYCGGRGYAGRVAMFEMVEIDEDLSRAVAGGAGEAEILADARVKKLPLLIDDAIEKIGAGVTTFEEILPTVMDW